MGEHDDDLASEVIEGEEIETDAFNAIEDPETDESENPIEDDETEPSDDGEL